MAEMIPHVFDRSSTPPGEIRLFEELENDSETEGWVALHSLDTANRRDQLVGEVDFVLIIPGGGVLLVEVKSHTYVERNQGLWYLGRGARVGDPRGPIKQVASSMHALRGRVNDRLPGLKAVPFGYSVVFTNCDFGQSSEEWKDWQIIDSQKLRSQNVGKIFKNVIRHWREDIANSATGRWFDPNSGEPNSEQVEALRQFLRPDFEFFESPKARAEKRAQELKLYTETQFRAIDAMSSNPRVVFEGPAGTGKTLLAIEAARRSVERGRQTLVLCFNNLLGQWLKNELGPLADNCWAGTLHAYMTSLIDLSSDFVDTNSPEFWREDLPLYASENITGAKQYDEIIVDESQDLLRPSYLEVLDLSLRGGLKMGRWRFFGDFEKQAIYADATLTVEDAKATWLSAAPTYSLRENCRNKPRVAELVHQLGELTPGYSRILRPDDGQNPIFRYYSNPQEQADMLVSTLAELQREGFKPADIVVLSPKSKDNCISSTITTSTWKDRLRPVGLASVNQTPYASVASFKGMEAGAVVVTDLETLAGASDIFYVAITRALHRLILLINKQAQQELAALLLARAEDIHVEVS